MEQSTIYELEDELIPSDKWDKELLSHFPEHIQESLSGDKPVMLGLGYREDVGYFCLAAGQGPHLIWNEKKV